MNNKEFISELARQNDLKTGEAQQMMNTLISAMGDAFLEGDAVQWPNFGTFEVKKKMERIMVNPTTGLRMLVPPKLTLTFKPSALTKGKIRKGGNDNG
ncbi:MAG: HU family DNA-binding protein [Prevotella sp.]|nr:HU family DNA-binding protein [Prevotella sp.]